MLYLYNTIQKGALLHPFFIFVGVYKINGNVSFFCEWTKSMGRDTIKTGSDRNEKVDFCFADFRIDFMRLFCTVYIEGENVPDIVNAIFDEIGVVIRTRDGKVYSALWN